MKIHFIQHETFEAPGAYSEWAKKESIQSVFQKCMHIINEGYCKKAIDDLENQISELIYALHYQSVFD